MQLSLSPITPENLSQVLALDVLPRQRQHIETTQECLDEAATDARWRPVAIYADDTVVGFAMYGAFPSWLDADKNQQVWLDRLLIDRRFQGHGYGRGALRLLLDTLEQDYATDTIFLSVYGDNAQAIALYEEVGFAFTGELDTKGEKVMRRTTEKKK